MLPSITSFCEENLFQNKISFRKARRSSTGRGQCAPQGCSRNGKHMMKVCLGATKGEAGKRRSQTGQRGPFFFFFFENEVRQRCRGYNREIHCRKSNVEGVAFAARVKWDLRFSRAILSSLSQLTARSFTLLERQREATDDRATYAGSLARALFFLFLLPSPLTVVAESRLSHAPLRTRRRRQRAASLSRQLPLPARPSSFAASRRQTPGALLLVSLTF